MINFKDAAKEIIDFEREMFEMEPQMGKWNWLTRSGLLD